jgi:GAF domain-containing protein
MDAAARRLQDISGRLDRGELDAAGFLEEFCRFLADHIGCTRTSVWLMADDARGQVLRCVALYDRRRDAMVEATDMVASEVGPYFDHLLRDGLVEAPDARHHPATAGFLEEYLLPQDVQSILDCSFSVNGQLWGAFCCEQTGAPVTWTPKQVRALRSVAARASLSLLQAFQSAYDTAPAPLWDSSSPQRLITRIQEFDPG